MDDIKCNSLKCRKSLQLEGTAVVTTCSHIFCVDCANSLFSVPQVCPACETALPEADDVVQTTLSPPDSYKTSVLSGLHPSIILDIASRALNFHSYQTQQEAAFQSLIARKTQERIAVLENQLTSVMRDANSEITLLKEKVATVERDLDLEKRRVRDLHETHKANAKAYTKLKTQYDKEKQRNLIPSSDRHPAQTFEAAAAAAAGNTIGARQPFAGNGQQHQAAGQTPSRSHSTSSLISQPDRDWSMSAQRQQHARSADRIGGNGGSGGGIPFSYHPGESVQRPRHAFQTSDQHNRPLQVGGTGDAFSQIGGFRSGRSTGSGSTGSDGAGAAGANSRRDHFVVPPSATKQANHLAASASKNDQLPQFLGQPLPSPRNTSHQTTSRFRPVPG